MSRLSFIVAHSLAIIILVGCWTGGVAASVAVVLGLSDAWLLLLAALLLWFAYEGSKNLIEWFSRVPQMKLQLLESGFLLGSERVDFNEVLLINCNYLITQKRQNFVRSGRDFTLRAEITDRGGKIYKLRAGQGPVTWFGPTYGADDCAQMLAKLRAGHRQTTALWTSE